MTRIAVVTGAGRGLGRALSVEFVRRGVAVAGIGRNAADLDATGALAGAGFHPVVADIADPAAVRAAFDRIAVLGTVGILVNNAALYPRRDILDETTESFMAVVAANLGGTLACTLAALGPMVAAGQGRILNVATFADVAPLSGSAAYAVSKGAARILTRALLADLGDRFPRIVINDWMPGMLATRMGIDAGLAPETAARWGVELALRDDPTLSGTTWEMDREILPSRSLKRRLFDRITGGAPKPRRL